MYYTYSALLTAVCTVYANYSVVFLIWYTVLVQQIPIGYTGWLKSVTKSPRFAFRNVVSGQRLNTRQYLATITFEAHFPSNAT